MRYWTSALLEVKEAIAALPPDKSPGGLPTKCSRMQTQLLNLITRMDSSSPPTGVQRQRQRQSVPGLILWQFPDDHHHKILRRHHTSSPHSPNTQQKGSRHTRKNHDAIYATIAIIQHWAEERLPRYYCFSNYTAVYPSVQRERVAFILDNMNGKMWKVLRKKFQASEYAIPNSLTPASSKEPIGRGLPEGSRLSPKCFGIFAA